MTGQLTHMSWLGKIHPKLCRGKPHLLFHYSYSSKYIQLNLEKKREEGSLTVKAKNPQFLKRLYSLNFEISKNITIKALFWK